jgi:hypothetical protein
MAGRPRSRSSSINEPGAIFSAGKGFDFHKERKRSKKKETFGTGRPVENGGSEEIHKKRGFPQSLGKASQKTRAFSTFPHRPGGNLNQQTI